MNYSQQSRKQNKRVKLAFTTVLVSSSLLLFMLGLWVNIMLSANQFSNKIKEEVTLTVYIDPLAKDVDVKNFDKKIKRRNGVSKVVFVSKEEAAEKMKAEIGDQILDLLDFNPFFDAYDIYFNADFVEVEQIENLESELKKSDVVYKVTYDKSVILTLNKNIKTISLGIIGLCVIFLFIAITLIYNSIRLSVHSKRFSIRTMQLVGASNWFIRKPFLMTSLLQGVLASIIAIGLNYSVLKYLNTNIPSFSFLSDFNTFLLSAVLIFAFGIVLSLISTSFAVKKYLHAHLSELYA